MTYQHNPADQQADEVCGIARQADGSGRGLPCVEGGTVHLVRDHPAPVAHKAMSLEHDAKDGSWTLTTHHALTDAEAAALTFQAYPAQVRMGAFVAITDLDGTRIGVVSTAVYHERTFGPAYVVVGIDLR